MGGTVGAAMVTGGASFPFLTVLVLLPAAGAAVLALGTRLPRRVVEGFGLGVSLATLGIAIATAVL